MAMTYSLWQMACLFFFGNVRTHALRTQLDTDRFSLSNFEWRQQRVCGRCMAFFSSFANRLTRHFVKQPTERKT